MDGLIPMVCGAIKRRRRVKKAADYERLSSAGAPPTRGQERFTGSAYHPRSQSCRYHADSPAGELGFSRTRDEGDRVLPEGLREEPFTPADGDGWRGLSRSRRFSSMRLFACVSGA
ncbi:unnamed protein product [Urochloa humidicola]